MQPQGTSQCWQCGELPSPQQRCGPAAQVDKAAEDACPSCQNSSAEQDSDQQTRPPAPHWTFTGLARSCCFPVAAPRTLI